MEITLDDPIGPIEDVVGTDPALVQIPKSNLEERVEEVSMATIAHLAMQREAIGSLKLKNLTAQVQNQVKAIDLLLDMSQELTSLPDDVEVHELTDKMKEILQNLEVGHGITLFKEDVKITKEKLAEFKAQIGAKVDKLRTELQTTVSTEIQPETQNLQNIMNIVQNIFQNFTRLVRKTLELPR